MTFPPLFHLQVAIKIIDKTQLNPSSLQKVRPREWEQGRGKVGERVLETSHPHLTLFPFFQLFREVRIMKGLNHPNIGEEKGVGSVDTNQGTWEKRIRGKRELAVIVVRETCFLIALSLLPGCVTLGESLNLSEPQCPPVE